MNKNLIGDGYIENEIRRRFHIESYSLAPPLPEKISIEINNSCNHKCFFCPNPSMERSRQVMDDEMLYKVLNDACHNGIKQVSFYSTGEPFLNKKLPDYVKRAKDLGFQYVYLSTHGGRVVTPRLQSVLDAGVDSLKFSINAGNRDVYKLVHGVDEFDDVIKNLGFVSEYRRIVRPLKLFVSFVETHLSRDTFNELKERVGDLVDEVVAYPFIVIGTPLKHRTTPDGKERPFIGYGDVDRTIQLNQMRTTLPCYQLWSYLNVTVEGYLSACCSDFNDDLIVGNLGRMSLLEAWHSKEFQELRERHIKGRVKGTLCASCISQRELPYEPLNKHLMVQGPDARASAQTAGTHRP